MKMPIVFPYATFSPRKKSSNGGSNDECHECCAKWFLIIFFSLVLTIIVFGAWIAVDVQDPYFQVESIAVSLRDDNVTAKWDVGVSVLNVNMKSYVRFEDFNVWVVCMLESSSQAVIPPFELENWRKHFMNASMESVLSSDHARAQLTRGTTVHVYFQAWCEHQSGATTELHVVCRGVGVGLLSGVMQGRKSCIVVEGSFSPDSRDR